MNTVLLTIEYDGTNFSGWQRQPGKRTVQGEVERVLSILCKQPISLQGSSRTDAGVHAYGQRGCFRGDFGIPVDRIPVAANRLLAEGEQSLVGDIRIIEAKKVDDSFHPRFDAVGKKYIYRIRSSEIPDIMQRNFCYHIKRSLDFQAMCEASAVLTGKQDFRSFMSAGGKEPESTVRTIYNAGWHKSQAENTDIIEFYIIGDGFLYNMVRIIVGTLVDIGCGKIKAHEMRGIINSRQRSRAGHTAPPQGLYLAEVYFNKEDLKHEDQRDVR